MIKVGFVSSLRVLMVLFLLLGLMAVAIPASAAEPGQVIVDFVWEDLNMDGIQDTEGPAATESGFPGVMVSLYRCDGTLVGTDITGPTGNASFNSLTEGYYYIQFFAPDGYAFSPKDQGSDDQLDSDADPSTGKTECFYLAPGESTKAWDAGLFKQLPPSKDPGTGTPGFWKNHPDAWPVDEITIGGVNYTKDQAISWLNAPVKGDKTITLFAMLVSAKLNVLIGNESSCVSTTIEAADLWFSTYGPAGSGVKADSAAWSEGGPLSATLDDYNNGLMCAPHRD